ELVGEEVRDGDAQHLACRAVTGGGRDPVTRGKHGDAQCVLTRRFGESPVAYRTFQLDLVRTALLKGGNARVRLHGLHLLHWYRRAKTHPKHKCAKAEDGEIANMHRDVGWLRRQHRRARIKEWLTFVRQNESHRSLR